MGIPEGWGDIVLESYGASNRDLNGYWICKDIVKGRNFGAKWIIGNFDGDDFIPNNADGHDIYMQSSGSGWVIAFAAGSEFFYAGLDNAGKDTNTKIDGNTYVIPSIRGWEAKRYGLGESGPSFRVHHC